MLRTRFNHLQTSFRQDTTDSASFSNKALQRSPQQAVNELQAMDQGQIFDQRAAQWFSQAVNKLQTSSNASTLPLIQLVSSPDYSSSSTTPNSPKQILISVNPDFNRDKHRSKLTQVISGVNDQTHPTNSDFVSTSIAPGQLKPISISAQMNVKI